MRVRMRGMRVCMLWGAQEEVVQSVWRAAVAPRERRHRQYVYSCTGKASKLSTEQGGLSPRLLRDSSERVQQRACVSMCTLLLVKQVNPALK
jgi:hypothetical protein